MWVGMATGAVQILPVIDGGWLGLELGRFFVAVRAGDSNVAAVQRKVSLLVLGKGKCGRFISLKGVTTVAGIEIGRGNELSAVPVGMTVGAAVELHFENGVLPFRDVTLVALHARMPAL